MVLTANWRNEIRECWGIHLLSQYGPLVGEALWVTRCSKTKKGVDRGTPRELYISPVNRYFYRQMEQCNLQYGVLSDKYGLHMWDEKLECYDVHPKDLSDLDKRMLGDLINKKVIALGYSKLIFYNPAPLMSIPYFEILHYSHLNILYTTTLCIDLLAIEVTVGACD